MGIAAGERIAVVSQNSARLPDLFYGATASGRIVVPINFRRAGRLPSARLAR
jgi:fatty-acyl-CoA synthase